jgi:hypothetical protein
VEIDRGGGSNGHGVAATPEGVLSEYMETSGSAIIGVEVEEEIKTDPEGEEALISGEGGGLDFSLAMTGNQFKNLDTYTFFTSG